MYKLYNIGNYVTMQQRPSVSVDLSQLDAQPSHVPLGRISCLTAEAGEKAKIPEMTRDDPDIGKFMKLGKKLRQRYNL